jgi:acetylornithine deacetylase
VREGDVDVEAAIAELAALVAFPSVSGLPNRAIAGHVAGVLRGHGLSPVLSADATGERTNVVVTIGPEGDGGIVLNGHTDIVPVDGQAWTSDPFALVRRDGRLYGRGSCDMKGFLACLLAMVPRFQAARLARPLHLAFTFDEEIGGEGAPIAVAELLGRGVRPAICLVGEPTEMRLVVAHKGGYDLRTSVTGVPGHASRPSLGVNAIQYAARFVGHLEATARQLAAGAVAGSPFDPPHSTINIGVMAGGSVRNIIAGACTVDWELRPLPGTDGRAVLAGIEAWARDELLPAMRRESADTDIVTEIVAAIPPLADEGESPAVRLVRHLTGGNAREVVSFGTDAGHFQAGGMSTVVVGPGSIEQAHKPDEFIAVSELEACLGFLDRLTGWLEEGGALPG